MRSMSRPCGYVTMRAGLAVSELDQRLVQRLKKPRPVGLAERGRAAADTVHARSQIFHNRAGRNRAANARCLKGLAIVGQHLRVRLQASFCQQDIAGDDHAVGLLSRQPACFLRDPVISGVKVIVYHHPLYPRVVGDAKGGIADDAHLRLVSIGNAIDLVFDRAGICIDKDCCAHHYPNSAPRAEMHHRAKSMAKP